jgi:hypothetical protein
MTIIFKDKKSKRSQKAVGIKVFLTFFYLVIEVSRTGSGAGSGSIHLTNGSGSRRPKNMWIRIRNTAGDRTIDGVLTRNLQVCFRPSQIQISNFWPGRVRIQCCGSGIFIPGLDIYPSRIRTPDVKEKKLVGLFDIV